MLLHLYPKLTRKGNIKVKPSKNKMCPNPFLSKEKIHLNKTAGISLNLGEIKILQIRVPEGEIEKVMVSSPCGVSIEFEQ